ncbi:MAG: MerR family transcriptional regulator [Fibrobacteria bacterium]|nr:MerR family transcriptional regulator [Fibrobacteria bacterium]
MKVKKKVYYSISDVAELTGLEQHVLRYWESEFSKLKPRKNRAGNRQYRDKDIQVIRYIKHLLQKEMYTVQGAKKKLTTADYNEVEGQLSLLPPLTTSQSTPAPQKEPDSTNEVSAPEVEVSSVGVDKKVITAIKEELKSILNTLKKDENSNS